MQRNTEWKFLVCFASICFQTLTICLFGTQLIKTNNTNIKLPEKYLLQLEGLIRINRVIVTIVLVAVKVFLFSTKKYFALNLSESLSFKLDIYMWMCINLKISIYMSNRCFDIYLKKSCKWKHGICLGHCLTHSQC